MGLEHAYEAYRKNAVIKKGRFYLLSYSREVPTWGPDIDKAWRCDLQSQMARRMAEITGGTVVKTPSVNQEFDFTT